MAKELPANSERPSSGCSHPYIRKGYYLGLSPGVYVCMYCAEQRKPEQWDNFEHRRRPPTGMLNDVER